MSEEKWVPPHIMIEIGKGIYNPYISRITAETDTSVTFDGHFYKAEKAGFLPHQAMVRYVDYEEMSDAHTIHTQKAFLVELLTYIQHEDTSECFDDEEWGQICLYPSCIQTLTWRHIRELHTDDEREQVRTALRAKYDPPLAKRHHVHYDDVR
jgi:hypothetical protein